MQYGAAVRYGRINPADGQNSSFSGYMAASQVIKAKSGRLVYIDSNGRVALVTASIAKIIGAVQTNERTPTVDDRVTVDMSLDAIYRIPINTGTFVKSMIGKTCDITISASNIQGADLTASARDIVMIVDGDLTNNLWVDVKIVPGQTLTGQGTGVV